MWVLHVDATCINYDGNAFDATLLAMVAALKNSELPSLPALPSRSPGTRKLMLGGGGGVCSQHGCRRRGMIPTDSKPYARARSGSRCRSGGYLRRSLLASLTGTSFGPAMWDARLHITQRCRTHVLADPTAFEEPSLDTSVSVVIDDAGGLISVMQLGLGAVGGQDVLSTCINAAKECWQKTRKDVYTTS